MPSGTIKFFNTDRGYGFIKPDDAGPDMFVHISGLAPDTPLLAEGQRVTYEVGTDRKSGKTKAADVRLAGNDAR
jgi:CspA family cold shock protein